MACVQDLEKVSPDKRLSPPKIDLKNPVRRELVDHVDALIVGEFAPLVLASLRKAVNTGKITLTRYLPGHIDRGR